MHPPVAGVILPLNISWIIGDACSKIPMPAVTLKHSTTHKEPELGRPPGLIQGHLMSGDHRVLFRALDGS